MRRIRSRFFLVLPALAALVLLVAACEEIDDNDIGPAEPAPATPTPVDDTFDDTDAVDDTDPAEPAEPEELRVDVEEIGGSGVTGEVVLRSMDDANGLGTDDENGLGTDDENGLGTDDEDGLGTDDENGLGTDDDANGFGTQMGQTEVEVTLSGLDEAATYSHGIFRGSCQDVENGVNGMTDDGNGFADDDDNGFNGMNDDEHMLDPIMVDEDGNVEMTSTVDADFQELTFGFYYAVFEGGDGLGNAQTGTAVACADLEEDDNGLFDDEEDDNGLFDDEEEDDDTF